MNIPNVGIDSDERPSHFEKNTENFKRMFLIEWRKMVWKSFDDHQIDFEYRPSVAKTSLMLILSVRRRPVSQLRTKMKTILILRINWNLKIHLNELQIFVKFVIRSIGTSSRTIRVYFFWRLIRFRRKLSVPSVTWRMNNRMIIFANMVREKSFDHFLFKLFSIFSVRLLFCEYSLW